MIEFQLGKTEGTLQGTANLTEKSCWTIELPITFSSRHHNGDKNVKDFFSYQFFFGRLLLFFLTSLFAFLLRLWFLGTMFPVAGSAPRPSSTISRPRPARPRSWGGPATSVSWPRSVLGSASGSSPLAQSSVGARISWRWTRRWRWTVPYCFRLSIYFLKKILV